MANAGVEEAVTRNCQALLTGNFTQIFADMTPEAMAKLAQLGGGVMPGTTPTFTSYDIISRDQDEEDHLYDVQFHGVPSFGVKARWREVNGLWKMVDFDGYQIDGSGDAGRTAAGPPA